MSKKIRIKTNWESITIREYEQIEQIIRADIPADYKAVNLLSVLSGEEVSFFENLPLNEFVQLTNYLDFITTPLPEVKVQDNYVLNNHVYELHADIPSITTAQFIDYQNYLKEESVDLQKVISVFLIPEGHKYNDGYNIREVCVDIGDMRFIDAQALGFFIQKQSGLFCLVLKDYLSQKMKKMGIPKKKIEEDLQDLTRLAYFHMS